MADNWYTGNAGDDSTQYRGWLLGHFIPDGPRHSEAVEVKWGIHPAGEARAGWATDETRTTLVMLMRGRFEVELSTGKVVLGRQGDYVVWGPGVDHTWSAVADSVVLTIRWPSE